MNRPGPHIFVIGHYTSKQKVTGTQKVVLQSETPTLCAFDYTISFAALTKKVPLFLIDCAFAVRFCSLTQEARVMAPFRSMIQSLGSYLDSSCAARPHGPLTSFVLANASD